MIKFYLFGSVRAEDEAGNEISFPTKKVRLLAAWLASAPGKQWSRAQLASRVWPDAYQDSAMASLRQALAQLRKVFAPYVTDSAEILEADRANVSINGALVWSDFHEVSKILEQKSEARWNEALDLAIGDFLEGEGEVAVLSSRNQVREQLSKVRRELFQRKLDEGSNLEALSAGHLLFLQDPTDAALTQKLVELAKDLQEHNQVLQVFELHRVTLGQKFGIDPVEPLRRLVEEIDSIERSEQLPACNVKRPQFEVFGRAEDIATLEQIVTPNSGARAVTLVGPGGIGKTTLARCVGESVREKFQDAVWFDDMSTATQSSEFIAKIQSLFGQAQSGDLAWSSSLARILNKRPALLILDNLEQLGGAGYDAISRLLAACPSLHVVSTSRRLLGLDNEFVFQVKPLLLPEQDWTIQEILSAPSVELYVRRASAVAPSTEFRDGVALGELCRKLDGLPLALCLAASKADVLTVQETIDQIERRFQLLESETSEYELRHRRLWSCIDWSYRLIPDFQRLFAQLSVFKGGWTAKSAEFVTEDPNILSNLQSLRRQSLIEEISRGREVRFGMLESIHDFATSKLAADDPARNRHTDYFMKILECTQEKQSFEAQSSAFEAIETELENIRIAFANCVATDPDRALKAAIGANNYFIAMGRQILGLDWLALAEQGQKSPLSDSMGIDFYLSQSQLLRTIRRENEGRTALDNCLQLAKATDIDSRIKVIVALSGQFLNEGRLKESLDAAQLGINLCTKRGKEVERIKFVGTSAISLLMQGKLDESEFMATEALKASRELRDLSLQSSHLYTLTHIALLKRDLQLATQLLQESIGALESIGMHAGGFGRRTLLAELEMRQEQWEKGLATLKQAVLELRTAGMSRDLADCAPRAAIWCENQGEFDLALSYLHFYEPYSKGFIGRSTADWRPSLQDSIQRLKANVTTIASRTAAKRFPPKDINDMAETILNLG